MCSLIIDYYLLFLNPKFSRVSHLSAELRHLLFGVDKPTGPARRELHGVAVLDSHTLGERLAGARCLICFLSK
jgi:hypothetical protein